MIEEQLANQPVDTEDFSKVLNTPAAEINLLNAIKVQLENYLRTSSTSEDYLLDRAFSTEVARLLIEGNLTPEQKNVLDEELSLAWLWLKQNSDIGSKLEEVNYSLANTPKGLFVTSADELQEASGMKTILETKRVKEPLNAAYASTTATIMFAKQPEMLKEVVKSILLPGRNNFIYGLRLWVHELGHHNNASTIKNRNAKPARIRHVWKRISSLNIPLPFVPYKDNYATSRAEEIKLQTSGEWDFIREVLSDVSCCEVGVSEYDKKFRIVDKLSNAKEQGSGKPTYAEAYTAIHADISSSREIEKTIIEISELGVTASALGASLRALIYELMRANNGLVPSLAQILDELKNIKQELINDADLSASQVANLEQSFITKSSIRFNLILSAAHRAFQSLSKRLFTPNGIFHVYSDDVFDVDTYNSQVFFDNYVISTPNGYLQIKVKRIPEKKEIKIQVSGVDIQKNSNADRGFSIVDSNNQITVTGDLQDRILKLPAVANYSSLAEGYKLELINN